MNKQLILGRLKALDEYLQQIPDLPHMNDLTPGLYHPHSAKASNSLQYWTPFLGLKDRRGKKCMDHRYFTSDIQTEQGGHDIMAIEPEQAHGDRDSIGISLAIVS